MPKKISKEKKQAQEYLAGWQRTKADFINYKKRQEKGMAEFRKFAQEDLILEILPILDAFRLAAKQAPQDDEWIKGILQIKVQLENLLESKGIEEIKAVGEKFNPELHEAMEEIKSRGKEGQVIEEIQKGYTLNNKVIRPSKVKVAK